MYAIIEDGSRQYRVSEGDVVRVDFRRAEGRDEDLDGLPKGTAVEFPRVMLYAGDGVLHIGRPLVEGARVLGEVVDHPTKKVYIQKFRRRKGYRRLRGHRQHYTAVRVKHILLSGQQPAESPPASAPTEPTTPTPPASAPTEPTTPTPPAEGTGS